MIRKEFLKYLTILFYSKTLKYKIKVLCGFSNLQSTKCCGLYITVLSIIQTLLQSQYASFMYIEINILYFKEVFHHNYRMLRKASMILD